VVVHAEKQKQKDEPGLGLKAAWAAAEQYGNLVGGKKDGASAAAPKVHLVQIPQPCMCQHPASFRSRRKVA
jgi:hypothetical protein